MHHESPADDDEFLQALACGDLEDQDPAVAARLQADPALARRWQELAATLSGLADLDAIRTELPEADGGPRIDAAAAFAAARRPTLAVATDRRAGPSHRRPVLWLAAAAALLIGLLLWQPWSSPSPLPDPHLGDRTFQLTPADAPLPAGERLTWVAPRGFACYRVVIEDPAQPANGMRTGLLTTPAWQPNDAEYRRLPPKFRWRVIAYDDSGQELATSAWANASRP